MPSGCDQVRFFYSSINSHGTIGVELRYREKNILVTQKFLLDKVDQCPIDPTHIFSLPLSLSLSARRTGRIRSVRIPSKTAGNN